MRAKTFAEHRHPRQSSGPVSCWRVDFVGPATAVMTNIMGHRRMVTFRQRRRRRDGPIMMAAKWIVSAVIWLLGMWMVSIVVMAAAMGVRL